MYKNEDDFVRGQKIKIAIIIAIFLYCLYRNDWSFVGLLK